MGDTTRFDYFVPFLLSTLYKNRYLKCCLITAFFILGNAYELNVENCYDFFQLGIIPNPGANECLNLVTNIGETITCCYNSIIPSTIGYKCPENSLGIENHCFSMNKPNSYPQNNTILDSEAECQKTGGNLIQFSSFDDIDLMADIFMSHPTDSFYLANDSFHVGFFSNPHFPFMSTSSAKPILNTTVDPRYLNETANEEGECTMMSYTPTFEEFMNDSMSRVIGENKVFRLESNNLTHKTEPWYWKSKHTMELFPQTCDKKALSICDHKDPLQAVAYNVSSTTFMDSSIMKNAAGFYIHPMNSFSACMAYCVAKDDVTTIIIHGKTCICSKGKNILSNYYKYNSNVYTSKCKI